MDEEELLKKRFNELYNRAFNKNINVFSDFLNMNEQSILKELYLPCKLYGGYENAQRVVASFGEKISDNEYPIECVKIFPVSKKFSDDLTHRDFLGAIMNLGIERKLIGDIVIKNNEAYLFCLDKISDFIIDNLSRVKHTSIKCEHIKNVPDIINELPDETEIIVTSKRIDNVICAIYKLSRSKCSPLFDSEKVFVNSKITKSASYQLKEKDIVSVRGFGRFIFEDELRKTKKDRLVISVRIFGN